MFESSNNKRSNGSQQSDDEWIVVLIWCIFKAVGCLLWLAILFPARTFTLLDSAGKRTRFLTQVQSALKLSNIHIVQSRAEQYRPAAQFDGVLSRAFAALQDMVAHCRHLCRPGGHYYAMKGQPPADEIAALPPTVLVEQQIRLTVPFESAARHLVVLTQH